VWYQAKGAIRQELRPKVSALVPGGRLELDDASVVGLEVEVEEKFEAVALEENIRRVFEFLAPLLVGAEGCRGVMSDGVNSKRQCY